MVTITTQAPADQLEPGTTVTIAAPTAPADFIQPTSAELRKLEALVYRLRPDLDLRADRDFLSLKHTRELSAAFLALSWVGRRAEPDQGKSITWWADYARELLREGGIEAQLPTNIVIAAALALGDVPYSRTALGLARVKTGTPATNAWRTVLKSGAVRAPSPEQATRGGYEPGQVRVTELALPVGMMSTGTR